MARASPLSAALGRVPGVPPRRALRRARAVLDLPLVTGRGRALTVADLVDMAA